MPDLRVGSGTGCRLGYKQHSAGFGDIDWCICTQIQIWDPHLPQITSDQAAQPHAQASAAIPELKHYQAFIPPSQGVTKLDNTTYFIHLSTGSVFKSKYCVYYTLSENCVLSSLHYLLTKTLVGFSATLHVQEQQPHLHAIAHSQETRSLYTRHIVAQKDRRNLCIDVRFGTSSNKTLITDTRPSTEVHSNNNLPATSHAVRTYLYTGARFGKVCNISKTLITDPKPSTKIHSNDN